MSSYGVVEIFRTLQGEGYWAGTPAVFVRFAGCNLWSGHAHTRMRDFQRNDAACALFCDTDFRNGTRYEAQNLAELIADELNGTIQHVVFTGGEPFLQLTEELLSKVCAKAPYAKIAVETNGTVEPAEGTLRYIDWVCLSPKTPPDRLKLSGADELKVVFPNLDPLQYEHLIVHHRFVQPAALASMDAVGASNLDDENTRAAVEFAQTHAGWRVSLQTHKFINLR